MSAATKKTILVSSAVYGIEELLERIYTLLTAFGYEVWMSHKGTVPVLPNRTAFENCIQAVEKCDLFFGIITPFYGSGKDGNDISITHQELKKAIALNKPRWLLAHDHVIFARTLLNNLGFKARSGRAQLSLKGSEIFEDLRLIDMYEEAVLAHKPLADRQGNWVQKFQTNEDILLFATAQFSRYQEVESFIRENLDPARMATSGKRGQK
jgi:nucleoside 2-deoxyribosyltransferase